MEGVYESQTHRSLIRRHLLAGKSITVIEALRDYGCYRLASRISELKKECRNIERQMVEKTNSVTGQPMRFARYYLSKASPEAVRGESK